MCRCDRAVPRWRWRRWRWRCRTRRASSLACRCPGGGCGRGGGGRTGPRPTATGMGTEDGHQRKAILHKCALHTEHRQTGRPPPKLTQCLRNQTTPQRPQPGTGRRILGHPGGSGVLLEPSKDFSVIQTARRPFKVLHHPTFNQLRTRCWRWLGGPGVPWTRYDEGVADGLEAAFLAGQPRTGTSPSSQADPIEDSP